MPFTDRPILSRRPTISLNMRRLGLLQIALLLTTSILPQGSSRMSQATTCNTGECGCSAELRRDGNCNRRPIRGIISSTSAVSRPAACSSCCATAPFSVSAKTSTTVCFVTLASDRTGMLLANSRPKWDRGTDNTVTGFIIPAAVRPIRQTAPKC